MVFRIREMPAARPDKSRPAAARWLTLTVLCVSIPIVNLDNTVLNVALPTLVRDLHALVFAGLLLVAGSLADRVGRKRTFLAGLVAFAGGSAWAAFSGSVAMLIAARASMGIGAAPGDLPIGQHIAAILGAAGQDLVAGAKGHRVERRVPGVGGVVEQDHLLASAPDQPGDRVIGGRDRVPRLSRGLIPADLGLPAQLGGHRVQRRLRQQRRAGVVQVDAPGASGCLRQEGIDVHPRACSDLVMAASTPGRWACCHREEPAGADRGTATAAGPPTAGEREHRIRGIAAARAGGTLVTIAGPPKVRPAHCRAVFFIVEPDRLRLADLAERVRSGRLKPIVGAVRPLAEVPSAFAPDRRVPGKTIIRIAEGG
jgi:hypothetical protein